MCACVCVLRSLVCLIGIQVKPGMDVLTAERSRAAVMIQGRQRIKIAKSEQTKRVIAILVLQRGMKRYYDHKMAKSSVLQRAYLLRATHTCHQMVQNQIGPN